MFWGRGIVLIVVVMAFGCNVAPSETEPDPVCGNGTVEVGERCNDWRDNDYYEDTPSGGWVDPQGPSSGYTKIFRGGMYTHTADSQALRAAYRYGFNPTWRGGNTGFRCVQ